MNNLTPMELADIKDEISRRIAEGLREEQQRLVAERDALKKEETDALVETIANYDPRKSNRNEYKEARAELIQRQKAAVPTGTSMSRSKYNKLEERRAELNAEMDKVAKNPSLYGGRSRIKSLKEELRLLPPEPDIITDDPPPEVKKDE